MGELVSRLSSDVTLVRADWTRRDPDLAPLHGDPEFDRLFEELQGLAPSSIATRCGPALGPPLHHSRPTATSPANRAAMQRPTSFRT